MSPASIHRLVLSERLDYLQINRENEKNYNGAGRQDAADMHSQGKEISLLQHAKANVFRSQRRMKILKGPRSNQSAQRDHAKTTCAISCIYGPPVAAALGGTTMPSLFCI